MKITVLSMFPKTLMGLYENPLVNRAESLGVLELYVCDIKDYTKGSFRAIDDSPYGGGKGMILRVDALCNALEGVADDKAHVVLFSPKGKVLDQKKVREFAELESLVLVCGHYEGVDARFEDYVDEQVSIGDFVLSGGENAAAVVCDAVARLLPGVLKDGCTSEESFENCLLEHRQYTHPVEYEGRTVPSVLLSGNDRAVALYKEASSIMETAKFRPDLLCGSSECDNIGMSSSRVLKFENFVLKINPSENEYPVYRWLTGRLGVPEVVDYYCSDVSYLLLERLGGRMLCSDYFYKRPSLLIKTVCSALKALWSVDISDCPFDSSPQVKLLQAKKNIESGDVEMDAENGFCSPEKLYSWLCNNVPSSYERCFTHGDFCLPNVFVSGRGKVSFIDVGLAGVGDKYCDIAICLRSLKRNADGKYTDNVKAFDFNQDEFFRELGIEPDWERIKWYTLLDELF